jgi:hypothetical protein
VAGRITNGELREKLLADHQVLRELMTECELAAQRLRSDGGHVEQLLTPLAALIDAVSRHCRFEEEALTWLLVDADLLGPGDIVQMMHDHRREHGWLTQMLRRVAAIVVPADAATASLQATELLRIHMAGEE